MQRGDPDHPVSTANLKCMAEKMGGKGSGKLEKKEESESWEGGWIEGGCGGKRR